jgi:hypothetical protein
MENAAAVHTEIIAEARSRGIRVQAGGPLRWLTARGHLDPLVQREAPADVLEVLDQVHQTLGGDRRALARKVGVGPRPDLCVSGTGQLVDVDGVQHFTTARLASLARYPSRFTLGFSLDDYRSLIDTWMSKAHAVFTPRASTDFAFAGGRRAQRAYYDALKDLLAPTFTGYSLVRLPVPERDARAAVNRLALSLGY